MTANKENIPNYRTPAILLTLLCCLLFGRVAVFCLPFGIVAIVYGTEVKMRDKLGDRLPGAETASKKAKKWFLFGLIVAIIMMALYVYNTYIAPMQLEPNTNSIN
ncbi:MAG: CD225/dispanin family protein [Okeania sp. SIO2F4]|uniref:CD225/dispanin family protein n=1 Tax=Okeania sp. SIO2F4 TaxID=2607790 RepID=UPI0014299E43|nr:CD225/dispanin family protein [Okeania sp. SIO2F4]NES06279.1 CD225/dispanin family protein [Okeania sp. SIO2F4]